MAGPARAALVALVLLAGSTPAAEPPAALQVTIAGALPPERDLRLHLRWDAATERFRGFATAPSFNRARGELDATSLRWNAATATLAGAVSVRLPSDGWVPKPPDEVAVACTLRLTRSGDDIAGSAVADGWPLPRLAAAAPVAAMPPDAARLMVTCEAAVPVRERPQRYRLPLVLGLRDGRVTTVRCPAVSLTDVSYQLLPVAQDLRVADGRLRGTLRLEQRTQAHPDEAVELAYAIDADVLGEVVSGRAELRRPGAATDEGAGAAIGAWLHGTVAPAQVWGAGRCRLTLVSALAPAGFVDVYLALADGRVARGFATTPNSGNAVHDIDAARLDFAGGRLRGPLAITVNPDSWTPGRRLAVELDLAAADGEAVGSWRADGASGVALAGCEADAPPARIGAFVLQCEDALQGEVPWRTRFEATCQAADSRITGGSIRNGHTKLAGAVVGGSIELRDGRLRGSVQLDVREGDGAATGPATVAFDFALVGRVAAGRFTCTQDGRTKSATGCITLREP